MDPTIEVVHPTVPRVASQESYAMRFALFKWSGRGISSPFGPPSVQPMGSTDAEVQFVAVALDICKLVTAERLANDGAPSRMRSNIENSIDSTRDAVPQRSNTAGEGFCCAVFFFTRG